MITFQKALVSICVTVSALLMGMVRAEGGAHINQVDVRQETSKSLVLSFYLNVPELLHQLLAPQLPLSTFLKNHSELPVAEVQANLLKASSSLSRQSFLTLPSGAKAHVDNWQWPEARSLQDSFRATLIFLNMPQANRPHLDPVLVKAELRSKVAISQVKLQLSSLLYPIGVDVQGDKFWLTEQIPVAVVMLR